MPPSDQILADIDKIEQALGGPDGINVRIARVEDGLRTHRVASEAAHAATQAELVALRKEVGEVRLALASGWRISVDPASSRVIVAVVVAVLSAFGAGGGARELVAQVVAPADAQQLPPATPGP